MVAYHEAGHALLASLIDNFDTVKKISIKPRGQSIGNTQMTPEEEQMQMGMFSKKYLENKICVAFGGRIAEEIVRGKDSVTTSAQNDLEQCT